MIDTGEHRGEDRRMLAAVSTACRAENRSAAAKVLAAGALLQAWIERDVQLGNGDIIDCGNGAVAEVAVRLGCSKTMAGNYADTGVELHLRLPLIRAAFESGELDYARVRRVVTSTCFLKPATAARIESAILAAARHLSPGPLGTEVAAIITREAPDEAAENRAEAGILRRVKLVPEDELSRFEATLTPDEGQQAWQLVTEMADTVCKHDRRLPAHRLADAFLALLHREPHLACTCRRDDCPQTSGVPALPGRRTPLVQITVDVATLLGLLANPAHLHGHGPIDPELARELARDATWQAMLTETLDLAEQNGLISHDNAGSDDDGSAIGDGTEDNDAPNDNAAQESPAHSNTANGTEDHDDGSETPTSAPPRYCVHTYRARGSRRSAGPLPTWAPLRTRRRAPWGRSQMADVLLAAITADAALALGEHPDGHGGHAEPPPGSLNYRPDAATAALVRARDQHCRFPGCHVPAARCQLDHIVAYRHHDPRRGGWTILSNLQCLCLFHHQLKTMRLWQATALAGQAIYWTSTTGTLPTGASAPHSPPLAPRLTRPPRMTSPPIVPPAPDDDPPPF
ncbi:DUF222 domain-containing protein [Rhodococcus sp. D2-41]|uniref:HNH endonuclease n=1 Tax=Speluncibacter jeojiensis TaxID=2710754 RepID=A0A9X4RE53_9ACTN|nr:HNH endonuclease signature motif containing protein [Rhodococcus sp. D2-41]MDG3012205.1 DUF222 domain-containing protein [Rhodococcus sp. D2-41]MDG3014827.1 HNH endonuclease [Corynebacteriales bacterium D3-21]